MEHDSQPEAYCVHVWIREIHPMPQAFLDRRAAAPWRARELLDDLLEGVKARDTEVLDYCLEELQPWQEWLMLYRFDRRRVNRRLRQYAEGAPGSMDSRGEWQ
ncbi:MAG: hypothetical protein WCC08_03120 [Terrimicrobiaceae bacterium]